MTTAIVLNWNELHIVKDTVRRLKREVPVIVVDNGSTDGSFEYFRDHPDPRVEFLPLNENKGNALARNEAIKKVKTDYFFLIDGDILYVPGSIKVLESILSVYKDAGCVGVHSPEQVKNYGHNGTRNIMEANLRAENPTAIFKGWPMAWTQYGLFRTKDILFPSTAPFDGPGMGWEDDYYYMLIREKGLHSYFITTPMYFHEAHHGKTQFDEMGKDTREKERMEAFFQRWGQKETVNIEKVL